VATIALLRLHAYTNDAGYREKAEQTLEIFAGVAGQYGIFGAAYGLAGTHFAHPHTQIVVVGDDEVAERLVRAALKPYIANKSVLKLAGNEIAAQNLPPALAETIPNVPGVFSGKSMAIVCSGFTCQPPVSDPDQLTTLLRGTLGKSL
jgi:hypothetical protein